MGHSPIFITGCARSGTSLTAGLIELGGAFGGKTMPPCADNKKGLFENKQIREKIIKPYLMRGGYSRSGQKNLPDIDKLIPFPGLGFFMQAILESEGYKGGPWYYKGAKLCLIWPIVHKAFPHARWIICRRPDEGIIQSCLKTKFMRAYRGAKGWQGWIDVHKKRFDEMEAAGLDVKTIWPGKLLEGDDTELKAILKWAGLKYKKKAMNKFIAPELWTDTGAKNE
jgi:hypothetical protein